MIEGIRKDCVERFGSDEQATGMDILIAYSGTDKTEVNQWEQEVREAFPGHDEIIVNPLSLSVSCHIGPGAIAVTCSKKLEEI